jgi:hypothetical protein
MKRARKPIPGLSEPSAAQIARMSGLSVSRVYRLLSEGRTGAQIVAQAQRRKEEAALNVLPATPVNGHAANGGLTFAAAQTQKEIWTGKLRELEYMERCGTLVPNSYVRHWGTGFCIAIRDEMRKVSELTDVLAAESNPAQIQILLDNWVGRVLDRLHSLESLWAASRGVM